MSIILGILIGIFSLLFLITAHEFGHFLAARRNGVKVNEFGICFPPRACAWIKGKDKKWHKLPKSEWGKPQDSLVLSLNYLPIGGFCAMDGESNADKRPHTFGAATFWQKTKILFAGIAANWLIAFLVLTVLAWTGLPSLVNNQFIFEPDANSYVDERFEPNITITKYTWSAPLVGAVTTAQLTGETFKSLGQLLYNLFSGIINQFSLDGDTRQAGREAIGEAGESVSGVVGIVGIFFPLYVQLGATFVFFLIALISISLACMNILPIPALDGGRWLLIAIYKLRKKELTPEIEEKITVRAFYVVFALLILVTIIDILRLF